MRNYFCLGPVPSEENCAQVGELGYRRKAIAECYRFIQLIRETRGHEPEGAELRLKAFDDDCGVYYEVVCWFDTDIPSSVAYARACKDDAPETWGDTPAVALKTCPTCGSALEALLFLGVEPHGSVCPRCKIHYNDDLKPDAQVIDGERR